MHLPIILLGFISPSSPFLHFLCLGPTREAINKELTVGDSETISSPHNICAYALCMCVRLSGKLSIVDLQCNTSTYRLFYFFFFLLEILENSLNSSAHWSFLKFEFCWGSFILQAKSFQFLVSPLGLAQCLVYGKCKESFFNQWFLLFYFFQINNF